MDILGNALADFYRTGTNDVLWIQNSYDDPEEMPVDVFFRSPAEMPELELVALQHCNGHILDVGAGVGSHALYLQAAGKEVTAVELSPQAASIMQARHVRRILNQDFFALDGQRFDTLLFLMNGIGLAGSIPGFIALLEHSAKLLNDGGQLLFDSSDIAYLYQEGLQPPEGKYYGEVSYRYTYKNEDGEWFNWLYIDPETLANIAAGHGWKLMLLYEDDNDQYLARLTRSTVQ